MYFACRFVNDLAQHVHQEDQLSWQRVLRGPLSASHELRFRGLTFQSLKVFLILTRPCLQVLKFELLFDGKPQGVVTARFE
jgi:hypothetical protein